MTFSALLVLCAGNSLVTGEFPAKRPVTRSFDAFFALRLNIRLSKQWWGWWFETPSRPLLRHCNDYHGTRNKQINVIYGRSILINRCLWHMFTLYVVTCNNQLSLSQFISENLYWSILLRWRDASMRQRMGSSLVVCRWQRIRHQDITNQTKPLSTKADVLSIGPLGVND